MERALPEVNSPGLARSSDLELLPRGAVVGHSPFAGTRERTTKLRYIKDAVYGRAPGTSSIV